MIKYSIILIKWDILNKDKIGKKIVYTKNGYNGKFLLYISIDSYLNLFWITINYFWIIENLNY